MSVDKFPYFIQSIQILTVLIFKNMFPPIHFQRTPSILNLIINFIPYSFNFFFIFLLIIFHMIFRQIVILPTSLLINSLSLPARKKPPQILQNLSNFKTLFKFFQAPKNTCKINPSRATKRTKNKFNVDKFICFLKHQHTIKIGINFFLPFILYPSKTNIFILHVKNPQKYENELKKDPIFVKGRHYFWNNDKAGKYIQKTRLSFIDKSPINNILYMNREKQKTRSFAGGTKTPDKNKYEKFGYSPEKSEGRPDRNQDLYRVRFKRKDLEPFEPQIYVTGQIKIEDVIDIKEVFDTYDTTGMGVLLPNDLMLLLSQNGFNPNKKTVYEIIAEFDVAEAGGISFNEFMKAMGTKPYLNETKKEVGAIFKKYDRQNKGYLDINDLREINRHIKQNLDEQTLKLMLEKADSNNDRRISFDDFYSVMVKNIY